jgi:hypothetical protein
LLTTLQQIIALNKILSYQIEFCIGEKRLMCEKSEMVKKGEMGKKKELEKKVIGEN